MMLSKFKKLRLALSGKPCNISQHRLQSYYECLGLAPHATSNEIKKAYYELSKQFHPDLNKSESAASKFRDISAAYEVLGNVRLRRLYDKGSLEIGQYAERRESDEKSKTSSDHQEIRHQKFYQSRIRRTQSMNSRGPIYNFDEWARNHYGMARNEAAKAKYRHQEREAAQLATKDETSGLITVLFVIGTIFYLFKIMSSDNEDCIRTGNTKGSINLEKSHIGTVDVQNVKKG